MRTDAEHDNSFFIAHARFILPVPWLALAGMNAWEAAHMGTGGRWLAAAGFAGLAVLFHVVQRRVHLQRRARR